MKEIAYDILAFIIDFRYDIVKSINDFRYDILNYIMDFQYEIVIVPLAALLFASIIKALFLLDTSKAQLSFWPNVFRSGFLGLVFGGGMGTAFNILMNTNTHDLSTIFLTGTFGFSIGMVVYAMVWATGRRHDGYVAVDRDVTLRNRSRAVAEYDSEPVFTRPILRSENEAVHTSRRTLADLMLNIQRINRYIWDRLNLQMLGQKAYEIFQKNLDSLLMAFKGMITKAIKPTERRHTRHKRRRARRAIEGMMWNIQDVWDRFRFRRLGRKANKLFRKIRDYLLMAFKGMIKNARKPFERRYSRKIQQQVDLEWRYSRQDRRRVNFERRYSRQDRRQVDMPYSGPDRRQGQDRRQYRDRRHVNLLSVN